MLKAVKTTSSKAKNKAINSFSGSPFYLFLAIPFVTLKMHPFLPYSQNRPLVYVASFNISKSIASSFIRAVITTII